MKIQNKKDILVRRFLLAAVTLFLLLFLFLMVVGIKYWSLTRQEGQVELIQGPELIPDHVDIGEVYLGKAVFRTAWNYIPELQEIQIPPGIQQHAEASCLRSGLTWGTCEWTLLLPLQVLSPDEMGDCTVTLRFSNGLKRLVESVVFPAPAVAELEDADWRSEENQQEMAGKIPVPGKRNPWLTVIMVLLGCFILLLVILTFKDFFFRKKQITKPENCWESALREMETLRVRVQNNSISLEQAITQLTDIVREYLENRFSLPIVRLTTEEFLVKLEKPDSPLKDQDRKFLKSFLMAADYVKFAGVSAESEMFRQALERAEKLIMETKEQVAEQQEEAETTAGTEDHNVI